MVARRALLVGCNYPGTNAALNGCINDVWGTKNMLTSYYGFTDADITVMIDTDKNYVQPTGRNMKQKLKELVDQSQSGDILVFHFSGHGTQVPSDDAKEKDAKDEAICPCDMNVITDDDLRAIFMPLKDKPGVKLTFIADCCHSGTLLDHDAVVISGPKPGGPPPPAIDVQAIQSMLAALGAGGKREIKNRSLPFSELCSFLSKLLGVPVTEGNVRSSMSSIFGADASIKVQEFMKYAEMAKKAYDMLKGPGAAGAGGGAAGGAPGGDLGGVVKLLCGLCGNPAAADGGAAAAAPAAGGGAAAGSAQAAGVAAAQQNGTLPPPPHAGAKPDAKDRLPDEVGILITGCQDKETSADACPTGDTSKAHGALSNALHTVVKAHHDANPNQPITSRNLVIAVREALAKSGFAQNPCLECGTEQADSPFIVPS